ncbi:hypothetical protein UUU_12590 [Klebsiella pneumoniae subsp. pneumoniae DSM 30104 = JCM 1662 = NBRC 14940]|nr:hypothetical protein UUU_12590 [Klebsiella pneumoniae subsp. pneumoniae DSM 30104 = JCM 1662 = NBRC 14940]
MLKMAYPFMRVITPQPVAGLFFSRRLWMVINFTNTFITAHPQPWPLQKYCSQNPEPL